MTRHDDYVLSNNMDEEPNGYENEVTMCECGNEMGGNDMRCENCIGILIEENKNQYVNRNESEWYKSTAGTFEEFCREDIIDFLEFCEAYENDPTLDSAILSADLIERELKRVSDKIERV